MKTVNTPKTAKQEINYTLPTAEAKAPASQKPHGYYFSRWRNQNINGSTLNPAPKCQAETNHLS